MKRGVSEPLPRRRRLLPPLALVALALAVALVALALVVALALLVFWAPGQQRTAQAQGVFHYDIDPKCKRVDGSGGFDGNADVTVNVVAEHAPATIVGYDAWFNYDKNFIHVVAANDTIKMPGCSEEGVDVRMILSSPLPSTGGQYYAAVVYIGTRCGGYGGDGTILSLGLDINFQAAPAVTSPSVYGDWFYDYSGGGLYDYTGGSVKLAINTDCPTPTPTLTPTASPTSSPTATPSPTPSATPTPDPCDGLTIQEMQIDPDPATHNPETTKPIQFHAELSDDTGANVAWLVEPIGQRTAMSWIGSGSPIPVHYEVGNPVWWTPARDTHGDKRVTVRATWKRDGKVCYDEKTRDFPIFFQKYAEDYLVWPNWYLYWSNYADNATPSLGTALTNPAFLYGGDRGPDLMADTVGGIVTLYKAAATEFTYLFDPIPACYLARYHYGIDNIETTIVHELWHMQVTLNWQPGGLWWPPTGRLADTDWDQIPDVEETAWGCTSPNVFSTWSDQFPVATNKSGDEELWVEYHTQLDAPVGNPGNDWANPGKQSQPMYRMRRDPGGGVAAELNGTYSDHATDSDSDGLYDYLTIDVGVNVTSEGKYSAYGFLKDDNGNSLSAGKTSELAVGNHTLSLDFDGGAIRQHRTDGPYTLAGLNLLGEGVLGDLTDAYTTASYSHFEFEQPAVELEGTFSESLTDGDSDGSFDSLVLGVDVEVLAAGDYTLLGFLEGSGPVASAQTESSLTPGSHTIDLTFDGSAIRSQRKDGPYKLGLLEARDSAGDTVDVLYDSYDTSPYLYTDFEKPPAELTGTYGDAGVDTNSNGLYDLLRVTAEVDADVAGDYSLSIHLSGPDDTEITRSWEDVALVAGTQNVTLDLDGSAIRRSQQDGPYRLMSITLQDSDGLLVSAETAAVSTSAYNHTQFEGDALVGGIAELPDLATASAGEAGAPTGGSGWWAGRYAALPGGVAVALVALTAGAWYARRRWRAG